MPYIRPMYAVDDVEVDSLLQQHKTELRLAFAYWLMYKPQRVAWIPELLSRDCVERSENLARLQFAIDTGGHRPATDEAAAFLKHGLLRECPFLEAISFGIWIRSITNDGWVKHVPLRRQSGSDDKMVDEL